MVKTASRVPGSRFRQLVFLLVEEIYQYWLSVYYAVINEIYTNKLHRLRRSEMMGGKGGQTFYEINNYSFTQDNCKYVYFYMHLFPLPWSPINQLKAIKNSTQRIASLRKCFHRINLQNKSSIHTLAEYISNRSSYTYCQR